MSREDDEKDSCGWPCPFCKPGRCIKAIGHIGRSRHVCDRDGNHSWKS